MSIVDFQRTQLNFCQDIRYVDEGVGEEMKAEKVHLLALKPDEEPLEFINPSKRAFIDKAFFVDGGVKMAPAPALHPFTIAFVFGNIRSNATVPQEFARIFGVKGTVSIKEGVSIRKLQVVKLAKQVFEAVKQA